MQSIILKYALQNAMRFGKAEPGKVIPKVIGVLPEAKKDMKALVEQVNDIVREVNDLKPEEREEKAKQFPELQEKKTKAEKALKELKNADDGVVMRFAPSPSGPMHIGHAITGGLTSLYVGKYGGKFILRIEDTNPEKIAPEAYNMLQEEARWLFGNVSEVWVQSDRMKTYYEYCKNFIEKNSVYVCECSPEQFREYSMGQKDCPCRAKSKEKNLEDWNRMLDKNGFAQGKAIVRFKAGMQNKNPAMRDFPLFRINEAEHPRQGKKYRVWPLMMMSVTVDDIEGGMTHIIRAKDHADNARKQEMMYNVLEKRFPETYFTGRYNFKGFELSASKTRERINAGEYKGWDDIRLPTMATLKKRGYRPESFLKLTEQIGLTPVDKTMTKEEFYKSVDAINKTLIEKNAKRYFFVWNPEKVHVEGAPDMELELDLHPEHEKGGRTFRTGQDFLLCSQDLEDIKDGEMIRLMDCMNIVRKGEGYEFAGTDYAEYKAKGKRIVHWLPRDDVIDAEVLMPDNTLIQGKGEKAMENCKTGDEVQLERYGFCNLQGKRYWYTQK